MATIEPFQRIITLLGRRWAYRYLFLFQKNLTVTNIQYGELRSILLHVAPKISGFIDLPEAVRLLTRFRRDAETITGEYIEIQHRALLDTIGKVFLIEPFHTCCVVYSPVSLPLDAIVAKCGYIHSCGPLILRDPLVDVRLDEFAAALRKYLVRIGALKGRRRELVQFYSHEGYPPLDWRGRDESEGLHEIKIDLQKTFFGPRSLRAERRLLETKLGNRVSFDDQYYQSVYKIRPIRSRERTVFIMRDDPVRWADVGHPVAIEDAPVLLCYDSHYRKNNRVHLLEERKPYWVGSTTTPQRLVGAMVNLVCPSSGTVLCDPFSGTGTTILEASQWPCKIVASDLVEARLAEDNLAFFWMDHAEFCKLSARVKKILGSEATFRGLARATYGSLARSDESPYLDVQTHLDDVFGGRTSGGTPARVAAALEKIAEFQRDEPAWRIACYLVRRTLILTTPSGDGAPRASAQVLEKMRKSILAEWSDYTKKLRELLGLEGEARRDGTTWIKGHFARNVPYSRHPGFGYSIEASDARSLSHVPDSSVDAVITDPPYGFNTGASAPGMVDLWTGMVREFCRVVKRSGGHFVFCTPLSTKTGKYLSTVCEPEVVRALVMREARRGGLAVQYEHGLGPEWLWPKQYYWKSKHGVDRAVLHFNLVSLDASS